MWTIFKDKSAPFHLSSNALTDYAAYWRMPEQQAVLSLLAHIAAKCQPRAVARLTGQCQSWRIQQYAQINLALPLTWHVEEYAVHLDQDDQRVWSWVCDKFNLSCEPTTSDIKRLHLTSDWKEKRVTKNSWKLHNLLNWISLSHSEASRYHCGPIQTLRIQGDRNELQLGMILSHQFHSTQKHITLRDRDRRSIGIASLS